LPDQPHASTHDEQDDEQGHDGAGHAIECTPALEHLGAARLGVTCEGAGGTDQGIRAQLLHPAGADEVGHGRPRRAHGLGRAPVRVGRDPLELPTGRSGIVTSFSSGGLTAFGHQLKPDVGAPGGQILSSTLTIAGGPFASFDGTSMAAPHVAGAAALLVQRHPGWTPRQLKSALVSTAGAAWADTARSVEAPVLTAGSGLTDVVAANDPKLFTDPVSLSFGDLDVSKGDVSSAQLLGLFDAGDGAGTIEAEEHTDASAPGQVTPPPLSPEGDAIP